MKEIRKNYDLYLMCLPAMLIFFLLAYLPMPGIVIAFKDFNVVDGIFGSPWNGLENFKFYFTSLYAVRTTVNTLWINFLYLVTTTVASLAFAIMLNELKSKFAVKFYQNAMFLPYFFSAVVIGQLVKMVVFPNGNGLANQILQLLGMRPIEWMNFERPWVWIIVLSHAWSIIGYSTIIYLATISGIDGQLYEAAGLDGATRWQMTWHITLPILTGTVIMLTLLSIGKMLFGDFQLIYSIIGDNGQLFAHTDIIETYIFRGIRQSAEFSASTAVGLYQSLVGFLMVMGSNKLVKFYDKDYALF